MFFTKQYRLVDHTFWDLAPMVLASQANLPVPSELAFAHLSDTNTWSGWSPNMKRCEWTSAPPHGEGSTRLVRLRGKPRAEQQVTTWEEGFRLVFCFTSGREPAMAAGAEEFWLRPTSPTTCELRWRLAIEPASFAKFMPKIMNFVQRAHPAGDKLQNRVPQAFANHMAKHAVPRQP